MNAPDPTVQDQALLESPEASPLWPLVLVLGEIASRIESRRAEEQATGAKEDTEEQL